jgi:hypothetical protein
MTDSPCEIWHPIKQSLLSAQQTPHLQPSTFHIQTVTVHKKKVPSGSLLGLLLPGFLRIIKAYAFSPAAQSCLSIVLDTPVRKFKYASVLKSE